MVKNEVLLVFYTPSICKKSIFLMLIQFFYTPKSSTFISVSGMKTACLA